MENKPAKNNSREVVAWVLIGLGIFWMLRKLGFYFELPDFFIHDILYPIRNTFRGLFDFIFSWQIILIIVGLVLMAGKRSAGVVLIIIGGIFLLPKIFFLPGLTFSFLFPVILVGIGIAMIVKRV